MAIKIGGTTVIDNSRFFTVTGAEGLYSAFQPEESNASAATGGITIDVSAAEHTQYETVTGNITFNLTGVAAGVQTTIFVDSSSTGYDQGFAVSGGTVLFPEDTEPTWTGARYWLHRITCWSSDTVSVVSTSWGS